MNKKTILNRTLPLIIALFVILVVAICVTIFSGDKKVPGLGDPDTEYLNASLGDSEYGYSQKVSISKKEIYEKLKNGSNGLTFLVDLIDTKLLTDLGYIQNVKEEDAKTAVEEAIFADGYDEYEGEYDDAVKAIENYTKTMFTSYGIEVSEGAIAIDNGELKVSFTNDKALKDYYTLILARKAYTREKMGEDQVEEYEKFIEAYEEYLEELHKFNEEEITVAPAEPTDASIITSSSVESDFAAEHTNNYWALLVTYNTQAEAEAALLQAGVIIFSSTWYEYQGAIDLSKIDSDNDGIKDYTTLASYYSAKGTKLDRYEILNKLVELYNNANVKDQLQAGTHYELSLVSKADYEALTDEVVKQNYNAHYITKEAYEALAAEAKAKYVKVELSQDDYDDLAATEKYGFVKEDSVWVSYVAYRAITFKTTVVKDSEGNVDEDAAGNKLYYTTERLNKLGSSVLSYVKSLSSAYVKDSKWTSTFSRSIQSKGSYYVLAAKFAQEDAEKFEDVYGSMYDEDKFEEDGTIKDLGFVTFTEGEDGKVFDYENSQYWAYVQELLDESITTTRINSYMAELRNEKGLIIYDEKLEKDYMAKYTSDYKATKKSNGSVVAKIKLTEGTFEVKADDLYAKLNEAFGAITALDAYQYENVLYQSNVIDYAKYLSGADLDDCVIVYEYALAKKGTTKEVTSWKRANDKDHEGTVEFTGVDGTQEYDVLVRKGTSKKDRKIAVDSTLVAEIEDKTAKKTTVSVVVSDELDYQDSVAKYEALDDTISSLKLYFTNGNFADYGYDASYGWKNFLRDYFQTYYGITIENNEDLKLYYVYEDVVSEKTELLATSQPADWNNIYLPFMQQAYDKFFSVDAIHFLISVTDEEGNMADPAADDTAWTAEQKAAAETLYKQIIQILKKTKQSQQAQVLQNIVDAFETAPKFVAAAAQTTEAQEAYLKTVKDKDGFLLYYTNAQGEKVKDYSDDLYCEIEYTAEFKGIELKLSEYKALGLGLKYEDLGTVTADKMVENFENALKLMWSEENKNDKGMQEGIALEANRIYNDYEGAEEYLTTEFGYHVLVANKFTGRATAEKDDKDVVVTLPSFENVAIYEEDGEEVDDLTDYEMAQIENFYTSIHQDYTSSYYYQLNVMKELLAAAQEGKVSYLTEAEVAKAVKHAQFYIETYYSSLSYIDYGYDLAMKLMDIATDAANGYKAGYNNVTESNLTTIINAAKAALTDIDAANGTLPATGYSETEIKEFNEAYAAFAKAIA